MNFINSAYGDLEELASAYRNNYINSDPFPSIHFRNFFNEDILKGVLEEYEDLENNAPLKFKSPNQIKLASKGENNFGPKTRAFVHFLNSEPFLQFLQNISQIEETLIPDPYLEGGGFFKIKYGGYVKIHAELNKHRFSKLDKRLNAVIYLNQNWKEEYGGHHELWNKDVSFCLKKVMPEFNTLVIFSTTDDSYHGSPNPLQCPPDFSNKSLSLFYYSNGRPTHEINEGFDDHSIVYKPRNGNKKDNKMSVYNALLTVKNVIMAFTPPIIPRVTKKIFRS